MMFEVIWSDEGEQRLAAVWLASKDRNAVTTATDEVDNVLIHFPISAGEPSYDTVRIFTHPPLAVEFEVIEEERKVFVLSVWDTDRGRPAPTGN